MQKQVLSQGIISAVFQIINFSFSLFITFYLIKNMDINDFGIYNILILFVSVASMLTTLNMHELFGIKISSKLDKQYEENILNTMLISSSILTLFFVIFLSFPIIKSFITINFDLENNTLSYNFILIYLLLNASVLTFLRYFMYKKNIIVYNLIRTLTTALWLLPLLLIPISIENVILLRVVFLFFAILLAIYNVYKLYSFNFVNPMLLLRKKIDFHFLKEAFKFGLGTYFATLSFFLLQTTDKLMLSYMTSNENVAYYTFANVPFSALYTFILSTFMLVSLPYINNYHLNNTLEKIQLYRVLFKNILLLLVPIYVFINIFSDVFILVFAKEEYLHVNTSYYILTVSYLIFTLTAVPKQELTLARDLKSLSSIYFLSLFLNIIVNYILIPDYGYKGAIIATMLSNIFIFIFVFWRSKLYEEISKDMYFYLKLLLWTILAIIGWSFYDKYFFVEWHLLLSIKFLVTLIIYSIVTSISLYYLRLVDPIVIDTFRKILIKLGKK